MLNVGDIVEVIYRENKPAIIISILKERDNKDKFKEMKTYYVVKHFEDEGTGEWLETSLRRLTA
jgi:hypothetical protein